ncbi:hypothetical protein B0T13DRAFT_393257, partial [Neurospora crassa]
YKNNTNTQRSNAPRYQEGNRVFLNTKSLNINHSYTIFIPLFQGLFEILKVDNYRVTF